MRLFVPWPALTACTPSPVDPQGPRPVGDAFAFAPAATCRSGMPRTALPAEPQGGIERQPPHGIILGMDSSERPTHGRQEGSAWNGHFGCTCYQPLFVFNQFGDLERCVLRLGYAHSAEGWRSVLEPVIQRYRGRGLPLWFLGDAAFARPELYELLEVKGIGYTIRMPAILRRIERFRGPPVAVA